LKHGKDGRTCCTHKAGFGDLKGTLQQIAATAPDLAGPHGPGGSSYAPGQEYVALLRWEPNAKIYRILTPSFLFPVERGA